MKAKAHRPAVGGEAPSRAPRRSFGSVSHSAPPLLIGGALWARRDSNPHAFGASAPKADVSTGSTTGPRPVLPRLGRRPQKTSPPPSRRMALRARAAAAALLFTTACMDRYTIPPVQLQYLNGYNIHGEQNVNGVTFTDAPYRLITAQGEAVDYNSSKELYLLGVTGTQLAPPGPFESILISESSFDAVPLAGPPVAVPLASISKVELTQYNPGNTTALITLFTLLATIIPTLIVAASHGGSPPPASGTLKQNSALK